MFLSKGNEDGLGKGPALVKGLDLAGFVLGKWAAEKRFKVTRKTDGI
jgi:hypothetical protein